VTWSRDRRLQTRRAAAFMTRMSRRIMMHAIYRYALSPVLLLLLVCSNLVTTCSVSHCPSWLCYIYQGSYAICFVCFSVPMSVD